MCSQGYNSDADECTLEFDEEAANQSIRLTDLMPMSIISHKPSPDRPQRETPRSRKSFLFKLRRMIPLFKTKEGAEETNDYYIFLVLFLGVCGLYGLIWSIMFIMNLIAYVAYSNKATIPTSGSNDIQANFNSAFTVMLNESPSWNLSIATSLPNTTNETSTTLGPVLITQLPFLTTIQPTTGAMTNVSLASTTKSTRNAPSRKLGPDDFLDEAFMRRLIKTAEKVDIDLNEAKSYCTHNNLTNCEINWPKILNESISKLENISVNVNQLSNGRQLHERCFLILEDLSCFDPVNATLTKVHLYRLIDNNGTLEVEFQTGQTFNARRIWALGPEDFFLLLSNKVDDFCFLTLPDHSCLSYRELLIRKTQNHH